jgi:hypothetical protein
MFLENPTAGGEGEEREAKGKTAARFETCESARVQEKERERARTKRRTIERTNERWRDRVDKLLMRENLRRSK